MAGAAQETQGRRPPRRRAFRAVGTRSCREMLAEHDGAQL